MRTYTGLALGLLCSLPAVFGGCDAEDEGLAMGMGDMRLDADAPDTAEQAVHNVCGSGTTVFGIDVSSWQSNINWSSVAGAGVKYAFIRVSDGANYSDSKFAANWSGAKAHGIKRGAYQFFRSNQDPIAQANLLINKMGALEPGDLPPVVDVESTDGVSNATRASKLHQWLDRVEQATGVKPIIYTGGYFWDDHVGANFSTYPLWHAGYTGGSCPSTVSSHWTHWTFWQFTSSGHVAGISGNVDEDRFNGTLTQLGQLGADPCTPTTEVCNGVDDNCDGVADEGATCTPRDEAIFGAAQLDAPGNTDIDGDGVSDVCARAAAGLVCALSGGGAPLSVDISSTSFADAHGWDDVTNFATMRLGDVTGDGKADVCARANAGVICKPSDGAGFGANMTGPALSDASGWNKPEYYSTLRLADVDGDGKADVCARGAAGFRCHLSTGSGFGAAVVGAFFRDADGFKDPARFGTIRMADVDGDGKADVCARTSAGVECHRFVDGAWGPAITGPAWSDAHGFNKVEYWSTLRFADLDGDHKDDACIRANDAIHCRLSTGTGFSATDIVGPALADAHGWADADNYATIRFGDVTGDGRADLCARANAGARCWPFTSGGAFGDVISGPAFFADAGGFTHPEEYRTVRLADVDGDHRPDLCGRDSEGFSCFLAADGFATRVDGPRWGNAHGWLNMKYSGTLMTSGFQRCTPSPEQCDGIDNDCNGLVDDGDACVEGSGTGIAEPPPAAGEGEGEGEGEAGHGGAGEGEGEGASGGADGQGDVDVDAPLPGDAPGCGATPPTGAFAGALVVLAALRRRRRR